MKHLGLFAVTLLALVVGAASRAAFAAILVQVDKPTQTMTVTVDGAVRYRWPVSTGATNFSTPAGSYTPFRMEVMHYSKEWDNAGMPYSIFFTTRGHAIHGSNHPGLGTPVSHGCVRLSLDQRRHALSAGRRQKAWADTTVIVRGPDPAGDFAPTQIPKRNWPAGRLGLSSGCSEVRASPERFDNLPRRLLVIPAKAGIRGRWLGACCRWIPAFAGMTPIAAHSQKTKLVMAGLVPAIHDLSLRHG